MPPAITITVDPAQLRSVEQTLSGVRGGARTAIRQAINDVGRSGMVQINRAVRDEVNLSRADVAEALKWKPATNDTLEGEIVVSRKPIPLIKFGARQTKQGVTVAVRKSKGRELLRHTFIATMGSGHEGVFERRGRGNSRVRRLPIDERKGPTAIGVIEGAPGLLDNFQIDLSDKLNIRLASKVEYLLQKNGLK